MINLEKYSLKKLLLIPLSIGPGIFAIGYTIGTGSVTSMIVAGSSFGMQLLWVLFLSCLFSGALIFVAGQYYLVTGETALLAFRRHLPGGKWIAIFILLGVGFGQWNSLIGILGITSNIVFEIVKINLPGVGNYQYLGVLLIAIVIIGVMYRLLLNGTYSLFEKVLVVLVTFMGLSFFFTLFFVFPLPSEIVMGLIPTIPTVKGGSMLVAAFVGTTMASATFLSRPLFIQGKQWTIKDLKQQKRDAIIAACLVFSISGSIMAVASGSLHETQTHVNQVIDMSQALTPAVGRFAVSIFFFGTLSAGLSSIFPCLLIVPIMLSDFQSGKLDTKSSRFKIITGIASVCALAIPVFGANPIQGQILTQVFNVFVLPLVIISFLIISNRKVLGTYKNGWLMNLLLIIAFIFSIVISYNGVKGIIS